jgi:aldehyde:ferredoxin oxidoreductase
MIKVIRVNTRTGSATGEEFKKEYQFFGNRGLIARVMNDEVNPKCEPLGRENKFIVCTGLFAGTTLSTGHRLSVGGKSPLTGTIKESNVGGNAGYLLAQHGIKMIIIEDTPTSKEWQLLVISKSGKAELVSANGYTGLNNYALVGKLKDRYGKDVGIISIGMAGERGYRNSSVQVTDASTGHPNRAAARGGLGALMGSKKIKAILIEKPTRKQTFVYSDKEKFNEANKKLVNFTLSEMNPSRGFTNVGTINNVDMTGMMALLPVRNYSGDFFGSERLQKINGQAFMAKLKQNGGKNQLPCQPGCIIKCSNIYNDNNGEYLTGALEYETVAMCGSNCDIDDLDSIAVIDRMCDDLGLDTIETGATIALCMEAGRIPWGDGKAAIALVQEMMDGTEFGKLLGQGTAAVGKKLGVKRTPTVKGQSLSGYEPRNSHIVGITYSTCPMGADHTAGVAMMPNSDMMPKNARIMMGGMMQRNQATCDNMMCMFAFMSTMGDPSILPGLMAGVYGGDWTADKIGRIGQETIRLEREFNKAAGFTQKDDCLPEFFYNEVAPSTGAIFDLTSEDMADIF